MSNGIQIKNSTGGFGQIVFGYNIFGSLGFTPKKETQLDKVTKLLSFRAVGKFGFSGGFGGIRLGFNRLGFYSKHSGIYSMYKKGDHRYNLKKKFYRPTNPRTEKQQAWRETFAEGMKAWGELDKKEKERYYIRGDQQRRLPHAVFLSDYLKLQTREKSGE